MQLKKLVVNRQHMSDNEHLSRAQGNIERIVHTLLALDRKAQQGKLPNGPWKRAVRDKNNQLLGYLVGRGLVVSTNLAANMVAKGQEV